MRSIKLLSSHAEALYYFLKQLLTFSALSQI